MKVNKPPVTSNEKSFTAEKSFTPFFKYNFEKGPQVQNWEKGQLLTSKISFTAMKVNV